MVGCLDFPILATRQRLCDSLRERRDLADLDLVHGLVAKLFSSLSLPGRPFVLRIVKGFETRGHNSVLYGACSRT